MLRSAVGCLWFVVLIACGKPADTREPQVAKQPAQEEARRAEATSPTDDDLGNQLLAKIDQLKTRMCACQDTACVEQVERDTLEWVMANADSLEKVKPTPAQDQRANQLTDEMNACKTRLAASPSGDVVEELLAKLEEAKDLTCACKDTACIDKVEKDVQEWMRANADRFEDVKPTRAQDERADQLDGQMEACNAKLKR